VTIEIRMPALSPTMESGTLAKWLVKEGDRVRSGSVIAEIETDKATMEFEAVDEGTVAKIVVPEGTEGVKVNDLIAVLLEDGEDAAVIAESATKPLTGPEAEPAPAAGAPPPEAEPTPAAPATSARAEPSGGERLFASPLARRIAAERGLDLASIKGSGPHGRIVKADVERAEPTEAQAPEPSAAQAAAEPDAEAVKRLYEGRAFEEVRLDSMRRTIAARLSEAKRTIPHFYLRRDIRLDALLQLRSDLNRQLEPRNVKLSVNDFIIKACALALQQVPDCNAVWAGDRVLRLEPSDIAVAVAIEGGLLTPVIRDAERKTLSALSEEMKDLAARARSRKLAPHEYQGGSFAISNLGMMGVDSFDAVINPPQASILAVGAGVARPVVAASGEIEVATLMSATLSVDHRVIDGALGAAFLDAIRRNLEGPLAMLA
jgi:pyruvate dehydrogenase E2 component (dihydrolipoamide acetyltransferase)